jgi:hypothetical protein
MEDVEITEDTFKDQKSYDFKSVYQEPEWIMKLAISKIHLDF